MTLETLLAHPAVQALGRALLHFLWQGTLLALLVWIVKSIVPSPAARLRYAAASLIMLMMPIALMVTAARGFGRADFSSSSTHAAAIDSSALGAPAELSQTVPYAPASSERHPGVSGWVVCIWILGVLALSARATGGWMRVQELRRRAGPVSAGLEDMLRRLEQRLRISARVRLCTSAMVRVPTAIGWLRPHILLPVAALTGLEESRIRAILAHELAHIRRHDYLANLLQTVVETVLFYHPAVWWVGRQMRLEREHCCDDIAVAVCGNAFQYASALAEMAQIRDRIPDPALAASGGELPARIRRVLGQDAPAPSLGAIAAAGTLLIASATAVVALHAAPQRVKPAASARFETASVKPVRNPSVEQLRFPAFAAHGRFAATAPLVMIIDTAYHLPVNPNERLAGGPEWIRSRDGVYAIDAVPEKDAIPAGLTPPERSERMRAMLRTLLAERFKLTIHVEAREMPYYALVAGKGGPKLNRAGITEQDCAGDNTGVAGGASRACHAFVGGQGRGLHARAADMGDLVNFVNNWTGRPLIDETGIQGLYRFDTKGWLPLQPGPAPAAGAKSEDGTDMRDVPTLFQVFQGLGLKMESRKGKVDVYVIDHIERPAEN